ncbi:HNH endonuclease [Anaeroselena agilis]|uniref:HNH endonuclease n=1 Tax=Anaeroselena agilis TaxID=3063788 RepID=A0ABU3NWZ9_9FIRM|nr:HNH endonuclease [Selenomonadales bacterium 4137-cl]
MSRDNFDMTTKETLAKRVGFRCSNPNCRKLTSGPQIDSAGSINIGVAAHISAASLGGPRYDSQLTSEERKSIDNGIWLCQNCAKLIDNDSVLYSSDILLEWKHLSEKAALLEIQNNGVINLVDDREIIKFFAQCFDRPAFQDPFDQEGSMENFDKAIEDTITAINTGALRARDGGVLQKSKGKAYLSNPLWRRKMDAIGDLLRALRERYELAVRTNDIHLGSTSDERQFYCINDRQLGAWFDLTRAEILKIFSEICGEAGISSEFQFPRHRRFWRDR